MTPSYKSFNILIPEVERDEPASKPLPTKPPKPSDRLEAWKAQLDDLEEFEPEVKAARGEKVGGQGRRRSFDEMVLAAMEEGPVQKHYKSVRTGATTKSQNSVFLLRIIMTHHPEIWSRVKRGKYKGVQQAARAAGILSHQLVGLKKLWRQASEHERQEFMAWAKAREERDGAIDRSDDGLGEDQSEAS